MADTLARKMALVAQACNYVRKTGRNDFHKYRYATAADVLAKVNDALAEHGVCATVDPEVLSESVDNGNRTVTVKVRLTLHDGDSEASFTTAGIGCGQDKGDKAVMKAQTAAIKYAWMLALNISTGDDPEADEETDKRAHAPKTSRSEAAPASAGRQQQSPPAAAGVTTSPPADRATPEQVQAIYRRALETRGMLEGAVDNRCREMFGVPAPELTTAQAAKLMQSLEKPKQEARA